MNSYEILCNLEIGEWYSMLVERNTNNKVFRHTVFFKISRFEEYYLFHESLKNEECEKVFKVYISERISIERKYSTGVKMIGYLTDSGEIIPRQDNIYTYITPPKKLEREEVRRKVIYAKFGV